MMNNKTISKWFSMLLLMLVAGISGAAAQSLSISDFSIKAGETKTVAIKLTAENAIYGVQTDLKLCDGLTLVPESAQAINEKLTLSVNDKLNGGKIIRMSLLSLAGNVISAGDIISLKLTAAADFKGGTIKLSNSRLTTSTAGAEAKVSDTEATVTLERVPTDVTSMYLKNPSFEAGNTFAQKKANAVGTSITDWTVSEGGNYQYYTVGASGSTDPDNDSGFGKSVTAADGSKYVHIRHGWQGSSTTITQTIENLPKGKYTLTINHKGATPRSKSPTLTLSATPSGSSSNSSAYNSYPTSLTRDNTAWTWDNDYPEWSVLSCDFELLSETNTTISIRFTDSNIMGSSNDEVIYDNVRLYYRNNYDALLTIITQASAINAKIGTLTAAIAEAQDVIDDVNNTPAYQAIIDDAIETLRSAISEKVAAYTPNSAGDDVSVLYIWNNGFEVSPTFDGTSLGSGSDPKSNATPTEGSTLLSGAANVYQIYGWELMTTETSDYARTFTMPYNTTLYVQGNKEVAGQAVASPANESSVMTDNNSLLFVEANWCQNAVLGVKQTVPLPAGSYRLTFDTYVTTTVGNASSLCGVSYGETTDYKWPTATNTWTNHEVAFSLNELTDVTISMGYKKLNNVGGGESAFLYVDNLKLEYFDELGLAQSQWQTVHDALEALDATALPDAAEAAITAELANSMPETIDGCNESIEALQALINSYDGIKAAYDKALALITLATAEKTNSIGTTTDIEAAINTATTDIETRTTVEALTEDYNTLETARQTYVTSGAIPTDGNSFDWTFMLTNPDFEDGTNGWTNERNTTGQYNYGTTESAMQHGTKGLDVWAPQINYIDVYQNLTLPAGAYELSAYVYSTNPYQQHIYANNGTDYPSDNLSENDAWQQLSSSFINYEEVSIKLGLYSKGQNLSNNTDGWFRLDNFQLLYKGTKPILNEAISDATALYEGANIGDDVFQIPSTAGTELNTAISNAQSVYANEDATASDVKDAIDELKGAVATAVATFREAELNAPDATKRYNIIVATTNHAKNGNAVIIIPGTSSENNPTGYGLNANFAPNANLNQTVKFTKVSGNTYNISFETTEGTTYLTYGTKNGSTAGWRDSQIQATTDESKKGEFRIAVSETAGTINIYNTITESTIACQPGGNIYTEGGNADFTVTEAAEATVNITIDAEVKYGTRIFPFKPTLPSGVKAYSCNSSTDGLLTLEEVKEPAADTPYILEAESGLASTDLSDWGILSNINAKTVGWLIGTYEEIDAQDGWYILQKHEGKDEAAFYRVDTEKAQPKVPAYRAYLSVPSSEARVFYLNGEATAIKAIEALTVGDAEIYDVNGRRQVKLQKGVNIIRTKDGRTNKVMVK